MRTIAEVEKEVWEQITAATVDRNPDKLAQLGIIARDIERKTREWDAMFEVAIRGNDHPSAAPATTVESVKPRNGDGRLRDYQNVKIRGFEFDGMRFPECHTYKGLLVGLSRLLRERHGDRFDQCVLQFGGRSRIYFSRNADDLKFAEPLGGLFVETNLNANLVVKICYDMVRELGYPETQLKIECGPVVFDSSLIG